MKKTISLFHLILLISLLGACKSGSYLQKEKAKYEVPENILRKADNFVMSKTGEEFFKKNIRFDSLRSRKIKEGYFIRYNYTRKEYPFVNEPVYFTVDSTGKPLKKNGIVGIPNCIFNPENCVYNIDETKAIEIAQKEGLAKGVKKWSVSFRWSPKLKRYVWHIISTTHEFGKGKHYKAEGMEMMIAPTNGEVLSKSEWFVR